VKTGAKLVHISSCSVYVDSSYSHIKVKEDDISKDFLCHYAHTKYLSDQRVEEQYRAHSVILRPRAIVGPGDELLLPKLIDGMREKRLPLVGADVLTDLTYIDNFVDFISATAFHLFQGDGRLKHHVYNISNGEPVLFVDLFELLAKELGLPRPTRRIPYWLFVSIGRFVEFIWPFTFGLFTSKPPPVTRYIAKSIGGTLTLDISRARTDLNYRPRIPISQGLERIVDSLKASKPTLTLKVN
jgi:2-alkyl-3-oxoalkanoate reductase